MADCSLLIRNGTVIDGTGRSGFTADVAISDGRIVGVGTGNWSGAEEIDARGKLVTPGFVDIHTHFDGQATWSNRLNPSTSHGVTTVVAGNCGVGFAPCRPDDHDRLIRLMEGVEDIPEVVLAEGLPWTWESFPEYLDTIAGRTFDADFGVYVPHAPLRVYAMGQRGADREPATAADINRMAALAVEGVRAGALGFSTSRTLNHRSSDRQLMPNVAASESELLGIAQGLASINQGILQVITDFADPEADFNLLRRVVERSGRPLSMSLLQVTSNPDSWHEVLNLLGRATGDGLPMKAQVIGRPVGLLMGLAISRNPFMLCPSYKAIAARSLAERLDALRDPALRARIIAEYPQSVEGANPVIFPPIEGYYLMDDTPDYEPTPDQSVAADAQRRRKDPVSHLYDLLLSDDGQAVIYCPQVNYHGNSIAAAREMISHPDALMGLGDGGAHVGTICDASNSSYLLTHWVKERRLFTIEQAVSALTQRNAQAMTLNDRGVIGVGYKADVNVIDFDALRLRRPFVVHDLPCGRGRLDQKADGYDATICGGEVTYRHGESTDNLPGRLIRGAQGAPR